MNASSRTAKDIQMVVFGCFVGTVQGCYQTQLAEGNAITIIGFASGLCSMSLTRHQLDVEGTWATYSSSGCRHDNSGNLL